MQNHDTKYNTEGLDKRSGDNLDRYSTPLDAIKNKIQEKIERARRIENNVLYG